MSKIRIIEEVENRPFGIVIADDEYHESVFIRLANFPALERAIRKVKERGAR